MSGEVQQGMGRAAAVLTALGEAKTGALRASDIARAIELGASTTARLLASLEELGYVRREPDSQLYAIGTTILSLGSQALNHNPVHRESRAAAELLAQRTGLSVNVGVLDGTSLIYLCHFEGALAPKSHTMVGMRQPLHASGLGKCLLLGLSENERRTLMGESLQRYTSHTIVDHVALSSSLAEAADQGYCIEEQELALGRLSIAAPIRDGGGGIVAGVSLSGRLSVVRELDRAELAEQLIETADRVSVGLGLISAVPSPDR